MALFMAMAVLIEPGDEVSTPIPASPPIPPLHRFGGGPVRTPDRERGLQPDVEEVAAKITPRTKVLITNSPNNPTGSVNTDEVRRRLAELAIEHDLLVLSDEIYARIVYGGDSFRSMLRYPGMAERTFIIDGFSKSFAMTGWRLGYVATPPQFVPGLELLVVNTFTCAAEFTQHAAIEALRDPSAMTPRMVERFAQRREKFIMPG